VTSLAPALQRARSSHFENLFSFHMHHNNDGRSSEARTPTDNSRHERMQCTYSPQMGSIWMDDDRRSK